VNLFDLFPSIRDQGERDTCLSLALTDGHQVARRSRQALSAEYLHFQASKRAGVELNQGVPVWAGRQTLSADGQPAEEACPYSAKARPAGWQLPPGITVLWRRETDLHPDRASESVRHSLERGRACVVVIRINDAFIHGSRSRSVIQDFTGPDRGVHAVLVVGILQEMTPPAFLVRNSWGAEWCVEGYGSLSESYLEARCVGVISYLEEVH
jgi:Papain family cysteine protease